MALHQSWMEKAALGLGLCCLASRAVLGPCAAAYLPLTGPAPLRFQAPVPSTPTPLPVALLRLPETRPDAPAAQATNSLPPSLGEDLQPSGTASATNHSGALGPEPRNSATPALPPLSGRPEAAASALIDPQAVMDYLAPAATNAPAQSGGALAPVFVPPAPPSSHAIYESR